MVRLVVELSCAAICSKEYNALYLATLSQTLYRALGRFAQDA